MQHVIPVGLALHHRMTSCLDISIIMFSGYVYLPDQFFIHTHRVKCFFFQHLLFHFFLTYSYSGV